MEDNFDASCKRECNIGLRDLSSHLLVVRVRMTILCSSDRLKQTSKKVNGSKDFSRWFE